MLQRKALCRNDVPVLQILALTFLSHIGVARAHHRIRTTKSFSGRSLKTFSWRARNAIGPTRAHRVSRFRHIPPENQSAKREAQCTGRQSVARRGLAAFLNQASGQSQMGTRARLA